ncbi:aldo/keto reductase [Denitromonas sp.]|uniref:aldo/keto reductase n=1 Tax=Denitromonas sp. TaxID=2734609 RepID=UPI002B68F5C9|nr:aldo/keto reductase [Denitromonas sp.]
MKLALGTVQFGLNYGVANAAGMVSQAEASRVLALARESGIDTLDTAAAYGESESVLGAINVDGWHVVSKMPPQIQEGMSVADWTMESVNNSLARLRQRNLYGILLHRPSQLLGAGGDAIYRTLQRLKCDGVVSKIGISIYDPEELDNLSRNFDFDLVQAPLSVVDRRLVSSGWMSRLADRGIELHVRSAFLQGLLLMGEADRPQKFGRWQSLWRDWHAWLDESGISAAEACVRYALSHVEVGRVVVGVQSHYQLAEIVSAASRGGLEAPPHLSADSEDLLNPARWPSLE